MYKFKKSIKLDESGALVEILVDSQDQLSVRAVDLVGDSWFEYLEHLQEAQQFERSNNTYKRNRALRSALLSLISHLDGVVSGLCNTLEKEDSRFKLLSKTGRATCTLKDKMLYLKDYVLQKKQKRLPYINLELKPLRDILVHPNVTKRHFNTKKKGYEEIDQSNLFDVSFTELHAAGKMVDRWLGSLTAIFKYPRGYDTKRLAEDMARGLLQNYQKILREKKGELIDIENIDSTTYRI
jgi:hypothetical protein